MATATPTGNHAQAFAHLARMGTFSTIDASINPADLTDDDHAEMQRIALHQTAYNELGRARAALLRFSTDYAGAMQHAESAIAAMAALSSMNGRA